MKWIRLIALLLSVSLVLVGCAASRSGVETGKVPVSTERPEPADSAPATTAAFEPQTERTAAGTETDSPVETEPAVETAPVETDPPSDFACSSAFTDLFPTCPDNVTCVLYNAPFLFGTPEATVTWNEGDYDQLYIIPRYIGSEVSAYALTYSEDGEVEFSAAPVYTATAAEGCTVFASLTRPEGGAAWYLAVRLPDGSEQGMFLDFNGRTGTPVYEFVTADPPHPDSLVLDALGADVVPLKEADLQAFAEAAAKNRLDSYDAAVRCFTQLSELGDAARYTLSYGHETSGAVYSFQMAAFHENYVSEDWDLNALVRHQYDLYEKIGNERGILGPTFTGELPELSYQLTGLSVFNHLLAAREISVAVNGETVGTYTLNQDSFCTLIPLDLPSQKADHPVCVDVTVLSTYFGTPEAAGIEVFGGLSSNISGAR